MKRAGKLTNEFNFSIENKEYSFSRLNGFKLSGNDIKILKNTGLDINELVEKRASIELSIKRNGYSSSCVKVSDEGIIVFINFFKNLMINPNYSIPDDDLVKLTKDKTTIKTKTTIRLINDLNLVINNDQTITLTNANITQEFLSLVDDKYKTNHNTVTSIDGYVMNIDYDRKTLSFGCRNIRFSTLIDFLTEVENLYDEMKQNIENNVKSINKQII